MADKWSTPKPSLPPHLRPYSRVTPTLALSEGPLSPSPITSLKTYRLDDEEGNDMPKFHMVVDSPLSLHEKETDTNSTEVEIIKLQYQMEQLTSKCFSL